MKKKNNNSTGVSGFQVVLAIALTTISAIAFASSFSPQANKIGDPATVYPVSAAVWPHSNFPVAPEVLQPNERETRDSLRSRATHAPAETPSVVYPDSVEWKAVPTARLQAPSA